MGDGFRRQTLQSEETPSVEQERQADRNQAQEKKPPVGQYQPECG
jgi:hypothetical protein